MDDHPLDLYQNNYKLFYISHVIGAQVLQDAIIYQVKRAYPDVKTFKEYEEENLKVKKGKPDSSKKDWLEDEDWKKESLEFLWNDWKKHKQDVTSLFRVFRKSFSSTAEFENVKELKDYRNRVCHAFGSVVKDETYNCERKKMRDLIMEIYKHMAKDSVKDLDIESKMKDIAKEIDEIDSYNFEQFKEDFDKNLCNFLIGEGRNEFGRKYKKYKLSTPFSWMWAEKYNEFDVCQIFTPLKGHNDRILDMKYILKLFSLTKIITFSGIAGSGKTSLCRFITREWLKSVDIGLDKSDDTEEIEGIGKFNLIFHIELREFARRTLKENIAYTCLRNYLLSGSLNKFESLYGKAYDSSELLKTLQTLNILFIIDGFDEASAKGKQIVNSIMEHFKDSKIILTTRLEYQEKVEDIIKKDKYKSITICGFDKKGRKEFLEKIFTDLISDPSKRAEELKEFSQMIHTNADVLNEHLKLPLTTALLVTLWYHVPAERGHLKSKTATELYDTMFGLWKKRVNDKLKDSQIGSIDEKLLKYLSKIAWKNLNDDTLSLEKKQIDDFKKECSEFKIFEYEVISGFLVLQGEEYHFMHKTEMEFLAAWYITEKLKEKYLVSEFFGVESTIKFRELFKYLTGCMFKESLLDYQAKELMKIIDRADIDSFDYNYWHSLVRESHRNDALCQEIERRLPKSEWEIHDGTILAGIGLLTFTNPKEISLMIYDNPYEIEGFLKGWERLPETCNRSKIQVKLILRHSWNIAGSRDTDEFLNSLYPWGQLTYYEGHLGQHCGKTLKNCYKLKHMLARISTVNALKALSKCLEHNKKRRALETLHITLDIPKEKVTNVPMEFKKHLDITIPSSNEHDIEWINDTVYTLGDRIGCRNLTLTHCDMAEDGIRSLVRKLVEDETVTDKLSLRLAVDLEEDTKTELENFVNKYKQFKIEFF
ncbi:uncharacterized protein LOC143031571 [Oratosquilla oratoria]|uniref:uncharacterized protein LOC143031571 n=1 Tax=Oratosquilla oratoria TaxID=337810 RepID=UPI003F7679A8